MSASATFSTGVVTTCISLTAKTIPFRRAFLTVRHCLLAGSCVEGHNNDNYRQQGYQVPLFRGRAEDSGVVRTREGKALLHGENFRQSVFEVREQPFAPESEQNLVAIEGSIQVPDQSVSKRERISRSLREEFKRKLHSLFFIVAGVGNELRIREGENHGVDYPLHGGSQLRAPRDRFIAAQIGSEDQEFCLGVLMNKLNRVDGLVPDFTPAGRNGELNLIRENVSVSPGSAGGDENQQDGYG